MFWTRLGRLTVVVEADGMQSLSFAPSRAIICLLLSLVAPSLVAADETAVAKNRGYSDLKVTFPTGRVFSMKVFDISDSLKPQKSAGPRASMVPVSLPHGSASASVEHKNGVLDGLTLGQW